MIKKLLLATCLIATAQLLNAAGSTATNEDSILEGVQLMSEEQMQSTTGEDITYTYIYPISKRDARSNVVYNPNVFGVVIINGDTGEILQEFYMPLNN